MKNPLEQFKINSILRIYNSYIDFTLNNSTIILIISLILIMILIKNQNKIMIIPNKINKTFQLLYKFIETIVNDTINNSKYIPLIFNLFLFIVLNNLLGLIPYSFTTTSHIILTVTMSLTIMIGVTILGFSKYSFKFFYLFVPSGLNSGGTKYLIPLVFVLELISYISRIISLSVRLTANMMSGHTLLSILSNFGYMTLNYFFFGLFVFIPLTIAILFPIVLLEIAIAFIQAYVFVMLTCFYIKDAENLH